jgi:hypothetical protein
MRLRQRACADWFIAVTRQQGCAAAAVTNAPPAAHINIQDTSCVELELVPKPAALNPLRVYTSTTGPLSRGSHISKQHICPSQHLVSQTMPRTLPHPTDSAMLHVSMNPQRQSYVA